jgi:hypothetical protein
MINALIPDFIYVAGSGTFPDPLCGKAHPKSFPEERPDDAHKSNMYTI